MYILGARPRLAFAPERVGDVAAALDEVHGHVDAVASSVLGDVLTAVRAIAAA